MNKRYLRFYLISLAVLLALSAWPLAVGVRTILEYWQYGRILPGDYVGYTIPYTAVCLSVLVVAALHPALSRLGRHGTPAALLLGAGLFTGVELYMESFTISAGAADSLVRFQSTLCVYTPDARAAFQGSYTDAFKLHYFLIAFILIALAVSVVYGYGAMPVARAKKLPLRMRLGTGAALLGLSVLANFTGFFRQPIDVQPPVSGLLTGLFFVVLGAAGGVCLGSFLLGHGKPLSVWLPALAGVAVCALMYLGEYTMMGGSLYRFGRGFFFDGLPGIALAPLDILVVLLSGVVTALAMGFLHRNRSTADANEKPLPGQAGKTGAA